MLAGAEGGGVDAGFGAAGFLADSVAGALDGAGAAVGDGEFACAGLLGTCVVVVVAAGLLSTCDGAGLAFWLGCELLFSWAGVAFCCAFSPELVAAFGLFSRLPLLLRRRRPPRRPRRLFWLPLLVPSALC